MGSINAGLFIALDGVVEAPDKWHFEYFNDEMGAAVGAMMAGNDAMLLGRQTYDEFAAYWPNADPADPITAQMNGTPKYVVSGTLESADWQNTTLIPAASAFAEIAELKQQPGKNIGMTGSGTLVSSLLREGLLDELKLMVCPIVVGKGRRLFEDPAPVPLRLQEARTFSTGVQWLTYQPADK
jgi:dihydrofolate reductase